MKVTKNFRILCAHIFFYTFFVLWTVFLSIPAVLLWQKKAAEKISSWWTKGLLYAAKTFLGITVRITGRKYLPKNTPYILACQHQSVWDTIIFSTFLHNPAFFLKKSLLWIPIIGWQLKRLRMIPVIREKAMTKKAYQHYMDAVTWAVHEKRPMVIFPEGTRVPVGQSRPYRKGVFTLHKRFSLPVFPVALNSGNLWPKHTFFKKPGTIVLRIFPALQRGLSQQDFLQNLRHTLEGTGSFFKK